MIPEGNQPELISQYLKEWQSVLHHTELAKSSADQVSIRIASRYQAAGAPAVQLLFANPQKRPCVIVRMDRAIAQEAPARLALRTYVGLRRHDGRYEFLGLLSLRPGHDLKTAAQAISIGILCPPADVVGKHFLITADYGKYLGELRGMQAAPLVTGPGGLDVVRPLLGQCLEACCCMSALLMARFGGKVYGLADIALALTGLTGAGAKKTEEDLYNLKDLVPAARFFRQHAELGAFHHRAEIPRKDNGPELEDVVLGLSGYIRSGFPVLFMAPPRYKTPPKHIRTHVVLLIGDKARYTTAAEHAFVYHDPKPTEVQPMLYVERPALAMVKKTLKGEKDGADCVVPVDRRIRAALLPRPYDDQQPESPGILQRSRAIANRIKAAGGRTSQYSSGRTLEDLGRRCAVRLCSTHEFFRSYLSSNVRAPVSRHQEWNRLGAGLPELLWVVEYNRHAPEESSGNEMTGFRVWDATKRDNHHTLPLGQCNGKEFWLKTLDGTTVHWQLQASRRDGLARLGTEQLRVAVITSYDTNAFPHTARGLCRHGFKKFDLYVFGSSDAQRYLRRRKQLSLAEQIQATPNMASVADRLVADLDSLADDEAEIVGLTTYLPGAVSRGDTVSEEALHNIVRLAYHLRRRGQGVRSLELVAGPRASIRSKKKSERVYIERAYMKPKEAWCKLQKVLKNLMCSARETASELDQVGGVPGRGPSVGPLRLVVEMEPGIANLVRDEKSLLDLLGILSEIASESDEVGVGLNVDISHFRLAGIAPDFLRNPRHARFIHHSHFNDMAPFGHMADIPIGAASPRKEHLEWLDALLDVQYHHILRKRKNGYSGYISLEAEASREAEQVFGSAADLRDMIEEAVWRRRGFPGRPPLGRWVLGPTWEERSLYERS